MFNPVCRRDPEFAFPSASITLKLNGFWPCVRKPHSSWFATLLTRLYTLWAWFIVLLVAFVIYAEMSFLLQSIGDVSESTENLCTTMMGSISTIRLLHARFYQRHIRILLQSFVDHIWIPKNTYPAIERGCEQRMKIFSRMAFMLMMALIMYLTLPLVLIVSNGLTMDSPDKPLPYKMLFPYDEQRGWRYIMSYVFAILTGFVSVTQFYSQDILFGMFVNYTCGQFEILHQQISRLVPECHEDCRSAVLATSKGEVEDSVWESQLQQRYAARLGQLIRRHNVLIDFCTQLERFNSFPLLVNFMVSTFLICMVGFQIATSNVIFLVDYVKFALYFLSLTVQLFAVCQCGQNLIESSSATALYLYDCNWEGGHLSEHSSLLLEARKHLSVASLYKWKAVKYSPTDANFQRNMLFMIMRSQRPLRLTAMRFSTLSLQSFSTILSSSMSYFMLLRTMMEK